jgi:hypothetical protein
MTMDADEFKIIKIKTVFYPSVVERHRFDADPKFGFLTLSQVVQVGKSKCQLNIVL